MYHYIALASEANFGIVQGTQYFFLVLLMEFHDLLATLFNNSILTIFG